MDETPPEKSKIDVGATKLVAFIGAIVMLLEGFLFLRFPYINLVLYFITGFACVAGGIILLLVLGVGFEVNTPIPYKWWLLLVIGGGVILFTHHKYCRYWVCLGYSWYLGGLLVGIAGLMELLIEGGKLDWKASKFVMLIGAAIMIVLSIQRILAMGNWVMLVSLSVAVALILQLFDVIPDEWWLTLIFVLAAFIIMPPLMPSVWVDWFSMTMFPVLPTCGSVLFVGFLLYILDE